MSDDPVRLLALDSFGTLFEVRRGLAAALDGAGVPDPAEAARRWVLQVQSETRRLSSPDLFRPFLEIVDDSLDAVCQERRIRLPEKQKPALLAAWRSLPSFPDVKPALEKWRDLGLDAWILTNGDLDGIQALLEANGLEGLIAGVVTAGAAQAYKPAPAIYDQLLSSAGAGPSEIVLGSALPADVSGAQTAGIRAAWIRRVAEPFSEPGPAPTWTVGTVDQLVDTLQPLIPRPQPSQQVW